MDWIDDIVSEIAVSNANIFQNLQTFVIHNQYLECQDKCKAVESYFQLMTEVNCNNELIAKIYSALKESCMKFKPSDTNFNFETLLQMLTDSKMFSEAELFIKDSEEFLKAINFINKQVQKDHSDKIQLCNIRRESFISYLALLDNEHKSLSLDDVIKKYYPNENVRGLVVVDPAGTKGLKNGVIHVTELQAGLQMCKNGGILFLRNHSYNADNFDVIHLSPDKELKIIGESCDECSVSSSLRIMSNSRITFHNIKFEIGDSPESQQAVNLFSGRVIFENCVFECFVNTSFYIYPSKCEQKKTDVMFSECILEGLGSCQRFLSIEDGHNLSLEFDTCYMNEAYCVLTVPPNSYDWKDISIVVKNCSVNDVQDGFKVICDKIGVISMQVIGCDFDLCLYSEEEPSIAVQCDNSSKLCIEYSIAKFSHSQGTAFSAKNVKELMLTNCSVYTDKEVEKKLSTTTCAFIQSVDTTVMDNCSFSDARIGATCFGCNNITIFNSSFNNSSVGIYIPKQSCISNFNVNKTNFDICFNGVLCEGVCDKFQLSDCQFVDILSPGLINKAMDILCNNCQSKKSEEFLALKNCNPDEVNQDMSELLDSNDYEQDYSSAPVLHIDEDDKNKDKSNDTNGEHSDNHEADTNIKNGSEDLKVYLAVKKQLPYQVAVENRDLLKDIIL